jgi:biotin synthase-related radical SAM superfamily protein
MKQETSSIENVKMNPRDSVVRKKAELQSRGIRIPGELIDELEVNYNAPAVRTGRIVLCLESPAGNGELIPAFIVNGKRAANSPLRLVKNDADGFEVWADSKKYTDATLLPRPRFYDGLTADGTPRHKLAVIVGPGHLRSVVNQRCYYQQTGNACRFCAVRHWWNADTTKAVEEIAGTVAMGVAEGVVNHISLTTATLNTPGKGLEHLVETARLIQARVGVPIMLEFEPIEDFSILDSLLRKAKQAGVTTVSCNIECFDESLRPKIMPSKGKIPMEAYIKTWEKCLEIFGENEVFTVAVVGIGETDESILRGVEMTASHGVMTFLVPHSPAIGACYEDMTAGAVFERYRLDLYACRAGCVRGGGFSAIKDVANFGVI